MSSIPIATSPNAYANIIVLASYRFHSSACGCSILLTLLTLAAGAAILLGFTIKQYQENQTTTQWYRENSSVILTEVNHFFTESLTVMEDAEHRGDFHHDIDVYQVEPTCSVITNWMVRTIDGAENTSIRTFYALADSSVFLNICGSTNLPNYPEQLEIVLQDHLEEPNSNDSPYKVKYFEPGLNGEMACKT